MLCALKILALRTYNNVEMIGVQLRRFFLHNDIHLLTLSNQLCLVSSHSNFLVIVIPSPFASFMPLFSPPVSP
jgi:hypothetical protein